jgi:acetoin utilization protein AcuB
MRVDELMTEDPAWVDVEATTGEAIRHLVEKRVHHLPILENGVLVGIVSDRDLRSAAPTVLALVENAPEAATRLATPVTDVMTKQLLSVTPDADALQVVDLMIEHHIGAVPVVDPGSDKLVGIVSYVDVLRVLRDFLT